MAADGSMKNWRYEQPALKVGSCQFATDFCSVASTVANGMSGEPAASGTSHTQLPGHFTGVPLSVVERTYAIAVPAAAATSSVANAISERRRRISAPPGVAGVAGLAALAEPAAFAER